MRFGAPESALPNRSWLLLTAMTLSLAGCSSKWITIDYTTTCDNAYPWYADQDGDGWGDPNGDWKLGCAAVSEVDPNDASVTINYNVANNRDCDDNGTVPDGGDVPVGRAITGRVGSLCPADIEDFDTASDGVLREAIQTPAGDYELLVVRTPVGEPTFGAGTVWPAYAEDVCGPAGWGGTYVKTDDQGNPIEDQIDDSLTPAGLAMIRSEAEILALQDAIADVEYWAGWVGVRPDGSGGWAWEDGEAISSASDFCQGVIPDSADSEFGRLALIKSPLYNSLLCLGTPDEVFGLYDRDIETVVDPDGDGALTEDPNGDLACAPDERPNDFDADNDGVGDGQECEVLGTDPTSANDERDEFPVLDFVDPEDGSYDRDGDGIGDGPVLAYQPELAYFVCGRRVPDPARWAIGAAVEADTDAP